MSIAYTKEGVRYCQNCFSYVNKSEAVGTKIRGQQKHYYRCLGCLQKARNAMENVKKHRAWIKQNA